MAQAYLDAGDGPGMLRLSVDQQEPVSGPQPAREGLRSFQQEDGDVITVTRNSDNCVQSMVAYRETLDGLLVQLMVSTCLAWDGEDNAEGTSALTEEQAIAVMDDERIGLRLAEDAVKEGAERFSDLERIG